MKKESWALYGVSGVGYEFYIGHFEDGVNGGLDGLCEFVEESSLSKDDVVFTAVQEELIPVRRDDEYTD